MKVFHISKTYFIVVLLLLNILFFGSYGISAENTIWDEQYSFVQEIPIPFDTSTDAAKYQPIDILVEFENPCWALDEYNHSIRVVCENDGEYIELESQIYNLKISNDQFISSCNLVFLIPIDATGDERYYIYYDDTEKSDPAYEDHVSIGESYYFYEPIPGYPLESYSYKIIDDDIIIYSVSQEGQFMGYNTGQHVYKMIEGATEVIPKNGDLFAAFDFKYCYDDGVFDYSSTSQQLLSKQVLTDGNIMVEFSLISTSKLSDLKTTATYKYYHCPGENSRIHVHVKHESLDDISIFSDAKTDGTYASIQICDVKSNSIDDLNIGQMLPYMHFNDEQDTIDQHPIDIDPDYIPDILETRIFSITDDIDLGSDGWVSFDEGEHGIAHAVIFNMNNFVLFGEDEQDGVQINAFEMDYPHLPGLENNIATIQLCRNSYEANGDQDFTIPDDFVAEFDAEFFSSHTNGFSIIEEESKIFQQLSLIKPSASEKDSDESENIKRHDVEVSVHFSSSFPMGSSLSAISGRNVPYITVELYKDNEFRYSANAVRLPMSPLEDIEGLSFFEKLSMLLTVFEWRNSSIFKTARFNNVEEGTYVIKVYLENPIIGKDREFIGYSTLDVIKDSKTYISCHDESQVSVKISDQVGKNVQGAGVFLLSDGFIISEGITDEDGMVLLTAPWQVDTYDLCIEYNDEIVHTESIKFTVLSDIILLKKNISIKRYDLTVHVFDSWELPLIDTIVPVLVKSNTDDMIIYPDNKGSMGYVFTDINPGMYQLHLKYKSFTVDEPIFIDDDEAIDVNFPAQFNLQIKIVDARGSVSKADTIYIVRENKDVEIHQPSTDFSVDVPPGTYTIYLYNGDTILSSRPVIVMSDAVVEMVTDQEPLYPIALLILALIISILFIVIFIFKNKISNVLYFIPISFIVSSFAFPWWSIAGSNQQYEALTNMYLYPSELVTLISGPGIITGETAFLPDIFVQVVGLIPFISLLGCILIILGFYLRKIGKNKLSNLSLFAALFVFIASVTIFLVAMNTLCEVGVGSIIGSDVLEVNLPGYSMSEDIDSNWGLAIGFYMYLLSIICVIVLFLNKYLFRMRDHGKK